METNIQANILIQEVVSSILSIETHTTGIKIQSSDQGALQ